MPGTLHEACCLPLLSQSSLLAVCSTYSCDAYVFHLVAGLAAVAVKLEIQTKYVAGCADASHTNIRRLTRDAAKEFFAKAMFNDLLGLFLECEVDAKEDREPSRGGKTTVKDLKLEDVESWTPSQVPPC
jgi:hypothetical protein